MGLLLGLAIAGLVALGVRAALPPETPLIPAALPPVIAAAGGGRQYYDVGDWVVVLPEYEWARVVYVSQDGQRHGVRFMDGYAAVYAAHELAK